MSSQSALEVLVEQLTAVPEYHDPLRLIYEVLSQQQSLTGRPLTLRAIQQHSPLLHNHAGQAQDQTFAVNQVIVSCKRIAPIPLPRLPLGF